MTAGMPTDIGAINAADDAAATAMILPFIERSPIVAARVAAHRPFAGPEALAEAIAAAIEALPEDQQLGLFRGHPELAPALPEAMTAASQREQGRLDVAAPDAATRAALGALNRRYRERFGFPFIIALHRHETLDSVLATFARRLEATRAEEMAAARSEIASVSRARILAAFAAEDAAP